MIVFETVAFALLGLILGSFTTALVYRVPRKYSWIANGAGGNAAAPPPARSACPSCGAVIKPFDLIPLLSWLILRGRCRHCRQNIPPLYPLIEFGVAVAVLATYIFLGVSVKSIFIMTTVPFLAALLIIDSKHLILPDNLLMILGGLGVLRLIVSGFIFQALEPAVIGINYILGGFIYAGLAFFLRRVMTFFLKKDALGQGDVKFFGLAGLWLGLDKLSLFCLLAGGLGIVMAVIWRMVKKREVFPFGPALILALYTLLLV